MPMTKRIIIFAVITAFSTPAYGDHLSSGSTWEHFGYYTECGNWKTEAFTKQRQSEVNRWLDSFKQNLIAASTTSERELEHKHISCSFKLNYHAQIEDIRIDQSSGSSEIDSKFLDLIKRTDLKKIAPPPITAPFISGLVISYDPRTSSFIVSLRHKA
jgi:hypothetical protein